MAPILLHFVPAALYVGTGISFWRNRQRVDTPVQVPGMTLFERILLLLALSAHGVSLAFATFSEGDLHAGFAIMLSISVWLAICFYWVESLHSPVNGLRIVVPPAGILASLVLLVFPGFSISSEIATLPIFRVHYVISALAYGLFVLAAVHAALMATATRQLHNAHVSRTMSGMPPLLTLEASLFRLIGVAFVMLTLTVATGVMLTYTHAGTLFQLNHMTIFTVFSWLLFGTLLIGRHFRGWRGRAALRWMLAGFVTLMLAYIGSRFVIEVLLHRSSLA